jgi:hypothetical protein
MDEINGRKELDRVDPEAAYKRFLGPPGTRQNFCGKGFGRRCIIVKCVLLKMTMIGRFECGRIVTGRGAIQLLPLPFI